MSLFYKIQRQKMNPGIPLFYTEFIALELVKTLFKNNSMANV